MVSKNILIVGGGLVGATLAEKLSSDGHDVTLIERDAAKVRQLAETLDVQVVVGNGTTAPVLRDAGVESADLVVASTNSDESNVVIGLLAAQLFRVPRVVVRVRDPRHAEGFSLIGRDHPAEHVCVNPDAASVERIITLLEVPGAMDVVSFMDGQLLVAGFKIGANSDLAGLRVIDMQLVFATTPTLTVAIHRGRDWVIPNGDEEILAGDVVYFAIIRPELRDVLSLVGVPEDPRDRVMIAGATAVGLELARLLRARDLRVVLIEEDPIRARRASEELNDVLVIQGLATDQALLQDEEIERFSNFAAVTDDHETNLVSGLLAKRLGAGRTFVLVDNPALVSLVGDMGIDAIISPRSVTIGLTLQHIRGAGVRSGAALLEDEVEIVEVDVDGGCRLTSGTLMEVKLPRGMLVAALRRGDEILVPRGKDRVEPGDRAVIIAKSGLAARISEYLSA